MSARLRKLALAGQNILELARAGRLTSPESASYTVAHESKNFRLRRYASPCVSPSVSPPAGSDAVEQSSCGPVLLIPPLMLTAEIYDMAPDVSVVAALTSCSVDVWVVDFGTPEQEQGGLDRTLDDHIVAIDDAIERVHRLTGRDVHLAGYSQGGMFAYQVAAYRKSSSLASVITFGSPVNLHRSIPGVSEVIMERLVRGALPLVGLPLELLPALPGVVTSTAFRLLSVRKEVAQLVEFVQKLHDRSALERRESKRLFLRGEGFVAWPGPALRRFVEDVVVDNRMATGGLVVDGRAVSLADIRVPILCFIGDRDELARPAAVRGIRRVAAFAEVHEVMLKAGHFGLVIGSLARAETWPAVVEWLRWRDGVGPRPSWVGEPEHATAGARAGAAASTTPSGTEPTVEDAPPSFPSDVKLLARVARRGLDAFIEDLGEVTRHWLDAADNARWQVPRLQKLRRLTASSKVSLGRALAERAAAHPRETLILWGDRAVSAFDANLRVDNVVRGLIARGVRGGDRVAVVMGARPSYLSAVCALNRLGAVAVLIDARSDADALRRAVVETESVKIVTDPTFAFLCDGLPVSEVMVLGGVHDDTRRLPQGVFDLESIDPASVALPTWYEADPGRSADLCMILASSRGDRTHQARISNLRWAFSAYGAAAACTLRSRDTVYSSLPPHHAAGTMVAVGAAIVGGARLALAAPSRSPEQFWEGVRRVGATVVFYAGEMCRALVDAEVSPGETSHSVRLFAGSGMRADVWRRLSARFGHIGVLEFYASTETNAVLVQARGQKIGSVGQPLPGSAELAVVRFDPRARSIVRDSFGRGERVAVDEVGLLVSALDETLGAAPPNYRLAKDLFTAGDRWFITGALMRVDGDGDHWYIDRAGEVAVINGQLVSPRMVEDALYTIAGVSAAVAVLDDTRTVVRAAVASADPLCEESIRQAIRSLPTAQRPREVAEFASLPCTDGFRYEMASATETPRRVHHL